MITMMMIIVIIIIIIINMIIITTERGCMNQPDTWIWLEADVRGIYPTYLIVEEVPKTIEIIN